MAESDEEHERSRNRDKFRRERSDYGDQKPRSRTDYRDRRAWRDDQEVGGRRRNRDEFDDERERRRHSSPGRGRDWSPPPHKRLRREPWEGFRGFPPDMMSPFAMRGPWIAPDIPGAMHHMPPRPVGHSSEAIGGPSKKAMLSFKHFLAQQDDSIDEGEAIQLYQEYKSDFKRKQITDFFDEHKEEDWLIGKYHPKYISTREEAQKTSLQSRLQSFIFLLESGRLDDVSLWSDCADEIVNTMDAGVILMEGGTEHDLQSLVNPVPEKEDSKDVEEEKVEEKVGEIVETEEGNEKEPQENNVQESPKRDKALFMEVTDEQRKLAQQARVYGEQMQALSESGSGRKRKRREKQKKEGEDDDQYSYIGDKSDGSSEESDTETDQPPPPGLEPPTEANSEEAVKNGEKASQGTLGAQSAKKNASKESRAPLPLHITRSVYIRHLPAKISSEDIVEICRTIPGYLRIAFADPDPNRGYERRGWVTYSHNTDIREVTARLTTNKVKDVQLNCMVNRELTRRIKFGQEVTWASRAVHADLHVTLNLVTTMDERAKIWEHSLGSDDLKPNPVVSIPDSLLSEDSSSGNVIVEEEEGVVSDPGTEILPETDDKVKALDRLIWYLRLVHSIDFYNGVSFPAEDCMPHRCGIFTVRPKKPTAVTQDEVSSYIDSTKSRIKPLLEAKKEMTDNDMEKFGKKDPDAEVERFTEVNTQKLAENKYLCPLSGKKFKGPDFVRKHIFNKHNDKVEAVRQEVIALKKWERSVIIGGEANDPPEEFTTEFFNNYLRDLDRPGHQNSTPAPSYSASPGGGRGGIVHLDERAAVSPGGHPAPGSWGQPPHMMFPRGGFSPGFPPGMMGGRGEFRSRGGRRGRGRKVINYHDLDAPEEMY